MSVDFKKPKEIAEMKHMHKRMTTILNELEVLEDGVQIPIIQ